MSSTKTPRTDYFEDEVRLYFDPTRGTAYEWMHDAIRLMAKIESDLLSITTERDVITTKLAEANAQNAALAAQVAERDAEIARTQGEPWLGLATTGQLLNELLVRCEINGTINYKTFDPELDRSDYPKERELTGNAMEGFDYPEETK